MLQNNGSAARHVVVLAHEPAMRALLCRLLRQSGYDCTGLETRKQLGETLRGGPVHLIVLDPALPADEGYDICRTIRERSRVPIVMVGAGEAERDRVRGLDLGADDFVRQPFGRSELLARVRAVLRRSDGPHVPEESPPPGDRFLFAEWTYRPRLHLLIAPGGAEVELTAAEHELLLTLLRHPQRMIGRERLLELTQARVRHSSERSIDMLVSRLRRKMRGGAPGRPLIRTIRGGGYMLAAEVTTE